MLRPILIWLLAIFASCLACAQPDYPGAPWAPANSGNYTNSSRPSSYSITSVIIHTVQGSYSGCISWFQNPSADASAHYVVRRSDGEVTQMVRDEDIAWHAGNWTVNTRSIGIEHEGYVSDPNNYTTAMYQGSAALVRWLCRRYNFSPTHNETRLGGGNISGNPGSIYGHDQVPDPDTPSKGGGNGRHSDPAQYWNWDHYMNLVNHDAQYLGATGVPLILQSGSQATVSLTFKNTGMVDWTDIGSNPVRLGTQTPQDRASPFYTASDWISPTRPTGPDSPIGQNTNGTFSFTLTAPAAAGAYTENYQLVREGITWFGPTVAFSVAVPAADRFVDNRSVGQFITRGAEWRQSSAGTQKYFKDYVWHRSDPSTRDFAMWRFNLPSAGSYDLYVWWTEGQDRTTAAQYFIAGATQTYSTTKNQRLNGGRWILLGRYALRAGTSAVWVNAASASGVVVADALKVVGPF